jgi:hypothetical protein
VTVSDVQLDEDFKADDRLFHYTSAAGLYGILESGCLWATHYRFLNDNRELLRARDALVAFTAKSVHRKIVALKVNREIQFKDGVDIKQLSLREAGVVVDTRLSWDSADVSCIPCELRARTHLEGIFS